MLSNHFWDGFLLGAFLVFGVFLVSKGFGSRSCKEQRGFRPVTLALNASEHIAN